MNKVFAILTITLICVSASIAHASTCEEKKTKRIDKAQILYGKAVVKEGEATESHNAKISKIEEDRAGALSRVAIREGDCIRKVTKAVESATNCGVGLIFGGSTRKCGNVVNQSEKTASCKSKTDELTRSANANRDKRVLSENASYSRKVAFAQAKSARMLERLSEARAAICEPVIVPTPVVVVNPTV